MVMVGKVKRGAFHVPNHLAVLGAQVELGSSVTPNTAAGVTSAHLQRPVLIERLTLTAAAVSVASGDDFGSLKLCDLPNRNLLLVGAVVDLAVTVTGFATNTAAAVDAAIGTVAMASVDFSGAGEDNLTPKIDGVGATATGTVKGASSAATINVHVAAAGTNDVFINVADPVTTGTGVATFTGTIDLLYIDLGVPTA